MAQLRNTQQKRLVYELIQNNKSHPTAEDIYLRARLLDPHISKGTVYRNLNLLAEQGNILRINTKEGTYHFDSRTDMHYHFTCIKCGKMYDMPVSHDFGIDRAKKDAALKGFHIQEHLLLFTGLCPECKE